jgi:hypothetical protein
MKTILRIFIILSLALGITAVTLFAVNASGMGTTQAAGTTLTRSASLDSGLVAAGQLPTGVEHGGLGPGNSGFGSLGRMLKNISIVAGSILVVALIERLLKKTGRVRKAIPVTVSNEKPGRKE